MESRQSIIPSGNIRLIYQIAVKVDRNRVVFKAVTHYGTATSSESLDPKSFIKKEKTSKAMKAYLERAREHDLFMKEQKLEFDIGKRHLANMMGESPETFESQDQIDVNINLIA